MLVAVGSFGHPPPYALLRATGDRVMEPPEETGSLPTRNGITVMTKEKKSEFMVEEVYVIPGAVLIVLGGIHIVLGCLSGVLSSWRWPPILWGGAYVAITAAMVALLTITEKWTRNVQAPIAFHLCALLWAFPGGVMWGTLILGLARIVCSDRHALVAGLVAAAVSTIGIFALSAGKYREHRAQLRREQLRQHAMQAADDVLDDMNYGGR